MFLNILHRPDKPERFPLFCLQQDHAHKNGLTTTILMTAESLLDPRAVERARADAAGHNDEIGLSFHGLTHPAIVDVVGYGQEALWLYSLQHKRQIISYLRDQFNSAFGFLPTVAAAYHFDSSTMAILREEIPSVDTVVAGCFEEGVRVFHGCNHSWYLFNEGMPWGPWFPAADHTLRPATDEKDWAGVVAVPHLMRDMVLSYEGRNDFWASHPPNVMRGMGYRGESCPYDRNLIDIFRWQEQFNSGYAYYNSFVSTAWLAEHHAIDDKPEVAQSLYWQQLEYLGELASDGSITSTTMSEFGSWFRANRRFGEPEVFFAKELLYGTGKHYTWYLDGEKRVLLDATQGGSIGDLRPYVARTAVQTGPESDDRCYGSYPYLIQSQHRTGYPNHSEDGSRTTCILTVKTNDEATQTDLATIPTRVAGVERNSDGVVVRFQPVELPLGITIESQVRLSPSSPTLVTRRIDGIPEGAVVSVTERAKLGPGITEYPQDLRGASFFVDRPGGESLEYAYNGRELVSGPLSAGESVGDGSGAGGGAGCSFAKPACRVILSPADDKLWVARAREGHLFSPFVTLSLERTVESGEEWRTCLYLEKT